VVAILGLVVEHALFSRSPVAIGVQAAAGALMLWARITFGRRSFHIAADPVDGGLVTSGPYHFIRHPIYTAVCVFAWAGLLVNASVVSVVAGGLLVAGAVMRIIAEERLVIERYPAYRQYAQETKRMIPYLF